MSIIKKPIMNAKSILIPLAAFAVTVTGASAFSSDALQKAGLTNDQISAFEEARTLRQSGDKDGARDVLVNAGIDQETMDSLREAMHEERDANREAINSAVEADDYDAFLAAIEGTPLADVINSEADFEQYAKAYELMKSGDKDAAKEIFDDLGIERPEGGRGGEMGERRNIEDAPFWSELSSSEQAAIKDAIEAGDHDKVREILDNAGIEMPDKANGPMSENNIEKAPFWDELSSSEQEALKTALANHDQDEVKSILDSAGVERPERAEGQGGERHFGGERERENDDN